MQNKLYTILLKNLYKSIYIIQLHISMHIRVYIQLRTSMSIRVCLRLYTRVCICILRCVSIYRRQYVYKTSHESDQSEMIKESISTHKKQLHYI